MVEHLAYWQNMRTGGMATDTVTLMVSEFKKRASNVVCASCKGTDHETQHCYIPVVIKAICRANPTTAKKWKQGKLNKQLADEKARSNR